MEASITVIIATTAEKKREEQIKRALKSVSNQANVTFCICVVVNGNRYDQQVVDFIKSHPNVDYHYRSLGNFPEALKYARSCVETPYFTFLDDDDELLDNSLYSRVRPLEEDSSISLSVGNGLRCLNRLDEVRFDNFDKITSQNALSILAAGDGNWLASCAGVYRTGHIGQELFDDYAPYAEWTYLAYRIALKCKISFIDTPVYRIHLTNDSLSSGEPYLLGQIAFLDKLSKLPLPDSIREKVLSKKASAFHSISDFYLRNDSIIKAWKSHLCCLKLKSGWVYIPYTRYLLFPWAKPKGKF